MNNFLDTTIRRTVSIPKSFNGESILALVDVGGKLLNKDVIYQKFFELGANSVKEFLQKEFANRGGSKDNFITMLEASRKKVEGRFVVVEEKTKVKKKVVKNSISTK
jgi:hypothetical protein